MLKDRVLDLKYEMLCERTRRRQEAAKAALVRRGVEPRVRISALFVPSYIAKHFHHCPTVGGVR
jgi:hypothetical protein